MGWGNHDPARAFEAPRPRGKRAPLTEMPRIGEDDIAAALIGEVAEEEGFELADLQREVLRELFTRLKDPNKRAEIPGTGLLQLSKEFLKMGPLDKPQDEQEAGVSVLDMVRDSTLPDERKRELLEGERDRLQIELELVNTELEGNNGGK